jgi:hypothetical protein
VDNETARVEQRPAPTSNVIDDFANRVKRIAHEHRPSRMPFFGNLAALPYDVVSDPVLLGTIHLIYQSAMHATRAAVYFLPYLDSPALRKRKLQIFIDDDGLASGDMHHYQLTRAFRNIGARCVLEDEEFGTPDELTRHLDAETAAFVRLVPKLYAKSLGPWCVVEVLSIDWMRALAGALAVHFQGFASEPYFADCFSQMVEERHAQEALAITQTVLRRRPELMAATLRDARSIAIALDSVWMQLDRIVADARARHSNEADRLPSRIY